MKRTFSIFALLILIGSTASAQTLPPGHTETGVKSHEDDNNHMQPFYVGQNAGNEVSCQTLLLEMSGNDVTISKKESLDHVISFTLAQESHFVGALQGWDADPDVELFFKPKYIPNQTYVYDLNTGMLVFTYDMDMAELPGDHKSDASSGIAYALEYPDSSLLFSDGVNLRVHRMPGPKYYPCGCVCESGESSPPTTVSEPDPAQATSHVYPNPIKVGETSHIRIGNYEFINLMITDIAGRVVHRNVLNNTVTLDTPGIYTAKILGTNKHFQIVVQ